MMLFRKLWGLLIVAGLFFSASCDPRPDLALQYKMAGLDASIAAPDEISYDLTAINRENRDLTWDKTGDRILVATFQSGQSYEKYYKGKTRTDANPTWITRVTVSPELKSFCRNYLQNHPQAREGELILRLKQYLGLSYEADQDTIIEMWVRPAELFRPCVDPEINDSRCELTFGEKVPKVKNIPDYRAFYRELYYKSFRRSPQTPWTGLGYTYDWGSFTDRRGASEFFIVPEGRIEVLAAGTPWQYCSNSEQSL